MFLTKLIPFTLLFGLASGIILLGYHILRDPLKDSQPAGVFSAIGSSLMLGGLLLGIVSFGALYPTIFTFGLVQAMALAMLVALFVLGPILILVFGMWGIVFTSSAVSLHKSVVEVKSPTSKLPSYFFAYMGILFMVLVVSVMALGLCLQTGIEGCQESPLVRIWLLSLQPFDWAAGLIF